MSEINPGINIAAKEELYAATGKSSVEDAFISVVSGGDLDA